MSVGCRRDAADSVLKAVGERRGNSLRVFKWARNFLRSGGVTGATQNALGLVTLCVLSAPGPALCSPSPPNLIGHSLNTLCKPLHQNLNGRSSASLRRNLQPSTPKHSNPIHVKMAPKKTARPAAENISLGPSVREGELVFGELLLIDRFGQHHVPSRFGGELKLTCQRCCSHLRQLQRHLR